MNEDANWLRRYASGDGEAFAPFVHKHLPLVYGLALRRLDGDPHRAAEIAQQVSNAAR